MDSSTKIELVELSGKENWATWKYNISLILSCTEGAMEAVEGRLAKPVLAAGAGDDEISVFNYAMERYKQTESEALLMLTNNMTKELLKKVVMYTTAHEVWQKLHWLFDGQTDNRAYYLCLEFLEFRQRKEDDVLTHMSHLKNLWNELKVDIAKIDATAELPELFLLFKVLDTHGDRYFKFLSRLQMFKRSERTIDSLTYQLCMFERELGSQENSRQRAEALQALVTTQTERQNKKNPDEWLICVYCSGRGHRFQNCKKWVKDGDIPPMPTTRKPSSHSKTMQVRLLSLMGKYGNVGAIVTEYVYELLESQELMSRLLVPENSSPDTGTFIFASPEYGSKDTLLLLVHGSDPVRAGQWARSLIINENIDKRTQIPYIRKAVAKDYGVLVLNTNDNYREGYKIPKSGSPDEHAHYYREGYKIPKSGSPDEHAQYVWATYVAKAKATSILIVAHGYGGLVTMNLAKKNKKEFEKRVKAIALTDSVHGYFCKNVPSYVLQIAKNWVSSQQPLDAPEQGRRERDVPAVSAGHPKHEMTSYSCMDSVFKFFEEKLGMNS